MKVLIVDDEQPARERLRQLLLDQSGYEVVGEAANGAQALAVCAREQPDIVLLDIRMPGMDGIETAHHLNNLETPPAIVFATAYNEYAMDAFDARAIGYVLKPVRRSRLEAALQQASKLAVSALRSAAQEAKLDRPRKHICVSAHGELRLIPIARIICFRADQKYLTVEHDDGQDLLDESLKALAEELKQDFVRIHRSALVAIERIERIEKNAAGKNRVVLRGDSQVDDNQLIISRRHVADVRRHLKGFEKD